LLFNFALERVIRKVRENQKGLELTGTHQLPVPAYNVNIMDENIEAIRKSIGPLVGDGGKFV
jgi:hypothetical protein